MGVKERHERERQAVRAAILGAARELFLSEGFRNVSMRKIADRIEYSPAAIYSYFSSKDDIFFALAEEGFHLLFSSGPQFTSSPADGLEGIRGAFWHLYQFSRTHPEYFALMFLDRAVTRVSQDFQRFEFFQETTTRAEADVRACIQSGRFSRELNPAAALHVLWVGMLGAAALIANWPKGAP